MSGKMTMSQIRAILAALLKGWSYSQIRQQIGVSNGFINKLVRTAKSNKISLETLSGLTDPELKRVLYPPTAKTRKEPDFETLHQFLRKRGVTLQQVYDVYLQSCSSQDLCYSYASFCRHWNNWSDKNIRNDAFCNFEVLPGERLEIDFSGDDVVWIDPLGNKHIERLFVSCLPYSGLLFAQVFEVEDQEAWLQGIVETLQYIKGVPEHLVMDNAKALVCRVENQIGLFQPIVIDLCDHYGMIPMSCKPAKPKEKNRVEASVGYCQRWIIGQMELNGPILAPNREALKQAIRKRVDEVNQQPWKTPGRNGSRRIRFEYEEKVHLKPLPPTPFEFCEWKVLVVDKGHCIRLRNEGGHRYSVDAEYIGKKMHVRLSQGEVTIFDPATGALVAKHVRCYTNSGQKTHLLPEHLTKTERFTRLSKEEWVNRFVQRGLDRELIWPYIEAVWETDFLGRKSCNALNSLTKKYSLRIIKKALFAAAASSEFSYQFVKKLCELKQLEERTESLQFEGSEDKTYRTPTHENIRNDYE